VKSHGAFIDIGEDFGLLHISEISDVRVTSMEALFAPREKIKVSFLWIKSASHCYNDYFYTWNLKSFKYTDYDWNTCAGDDLKSRQN